MALLLQIKGLPHVAGLHVRHRCRARVAAVLRWRLGVVPAGRLDVLQAARPACAELTAHTVPSTALMVLPCPASDLCGCRTQGDHAMFPRLRGLSPFSAARSQRPVSRGTMAPPTPVSPGKPLDLLLPGAPFAFLVIREPGLVSLLSCLPRASPRARRTGVPGSSDRQGTLPPEVVVLNSYG